MGALGTAGFADGVDGGLDGCGPFGDVDVVLEIYWLVTVDRYM